jgi:tRNA-2-methylthio-N6-dimethylallyladenosine synthase
MYKLIKFKFCSKPKVKLNDIPDIRSFLNPKTKIPSGTYINIPHSEPQQSRLKKFYIETYGCQMNENDTDIISTILEKENYQRVETMDSADIILTNTCAIRESAEEKVWKNIIHIKGIKRRDPNKIFGILGCMAERMKEKILERSNNIVDLIVGPDAYRDLPKMINILSQIEEKENRHAINVQLSLEETYGDIIPTRRSGIKAFLSIMRGCNNMCSFCIVPFTRGRERSRAFDSIVDEVKVMRDSVIY